MSRAIVIGQPRPEPDTAEPVTAEPGTAERDPAPPSLFDVLHNSLVLANVVPYLPPSAVLSLAAADRAFRALVHRSPGVFRRLDLGRLRHAQLELDGLDRGGARLDESLTEDDFYAGPLRAVFAALRRRDILRGVQTLILDGLSVTAELCHDIINDASLGVRILSVRDVRNLNQGKLRAALRYACRSTRPDNAPRLRALYVFGSKDAPPPPPPTPDPDGHAAATAAASAGSDRSHKSQPALTAPLRREGDAWWARRGCVVARPVSAEWADCMLACEGIIAFDALLCEGPRHLNSPAFGKTSLPGGRGPAVATFAVAGCESCGSAPEGLVRPTRPPARLPLLAPPPILASSVHAATVPRQPCQPFAARCADCLRERYCAACHKWWCEPCYRLPGQAAGADVGSVVVVDDDDDDDDDDGNGSVLAPEGPDTPATAAKIKSRISKSCWECGNNCDACIDRTQRVCRKCCGGYCIIHNEGSSASHCDWCVSRGRGLGRL